jgi:hypothetical protein
MNQIELGSEGMQRMASMYLDALAKTKVPPDPRVVKQALTAARSHEMNVGVLEQQDLTLLELLSRFEPSAHKGRAFVDIA